MTTDRPKERPAWERLDEEPEQAWAAFQLFLRLPVPRTQKKASDACGYSISQVKTWMYGFDWRERAAEWDEEQARAETRAILAERERIAKEHLRGASTMRQVGLMELQRRALMIRRKHEQNPQSDEQYLSDRDAIAMLEKGIALERQLLAEAREHEGGEPAVVLDTAKLTAEEVAQLTALLAKIGGLA